MAVETRASRKSVGEKKIETNGVENALPTKRRRRVAEENGNTATKDGENHQDEGSPTDDKKTSGSAREQSVSSVLSTGAMYNAVGIGMRRLMPFLVNLLFARKLSPEQFKLPSMHFHLITIFVLALSNAGFRRSCMRFDAKDYIKSDSNENGKPLSKSQVDAKQLRSRKLAHEVIVNLTWLSFPLSLCFATLGCGVAVYYFGKDEGQAYCIAMILHGVAAVIEVSIEPLKNINRHNLQFKIAALSETISSTLSSAVTCAFLLLGRTDTIVFGYTRVVCAIINVIIGLVYYSMYYDGETYKYRDTVKWLFLSNVQLLRPKTIQIFDEVSKKVKKTFIFEPRLLKLSYDYGIQAAVKFFLGEGEKLIMTMVSSGYDQGVYGLVSNLGSLIVRLIFLPIELAAFTAFSISGGASASEDGVDKRKIEAYDTLINALKFSVMASLLFSFFGPPYSYTLIKIMYGLKWSETEAPQVLSFYCYYVALLSLNGISEAFVHATASSNELKRSNTWMLVLSGISSCCSVAFIRFAGAMGLVASICVNMSLRITYSTIYIIGYKRKNLQSVDAKSLLDAFPSFYAFIVLIIVRIATQLSKIFILEAGTSGFAFAATIHILVGFIGLMSFLTTVILTDSVLRANLLSFLPKIKKM